MKYLCRYYQEEHIMICTSSERYHMFDQLEAEGKTPEEIQSIINDFNDFDNL